MKLDPDLVPYTTLTGCEWEIGLLRASLTSTVGPGLRTKGWLCSSTAQGPGSERFKRIKQRKVSEENTGLNLSWCQAVAAGTPKQGDERKGLNSTMKDVCASKVPRGRTTKMEKIS